MSKAKQFISQNTAAVAKKAIEGLPVSTWVNILSEVEITYRKPPRSPKEMKREFYLSR